MTYCWHWQNGQPFPDATLEYNSLPDNLLDKMRMFVFAMKHAESGGP